MHLLQAIEKIDTDANNPQQGLPQDVFYLVSRLTPLVNVDLLITDPTNRVLLAWRNDQFAGEGWHIPGGIVRYKETLEQRIQKVALTEIGREVEYDLTPIKITEIHRPHATRGHFISFLYKCSINESFTPNNQNVKPNESGYLKWHQPCPDNLIDVHELYRPYIEAITNDN